MTNDEVYKLIAQSAIYGNLGLFIGAGFSLAVNEIHKNCEPLSWPKLLESICKENGILWESKKDESGEIIEKSEIAKDFLSCPEIASNICELISSKNSISKEEAVARFKNQACNTTAWYSSIEQRCQYSDLLRNLLPNWIVTTNYDLILETLLPEEAVSLSPKDKFIYPKGKIPIYHLHGIRTKPETIVITKEDYIALSRPHNYRMEKLSLMFSESTTIMIGYAIGDQNVQTALDWSKNVYDEQTPNQQEYPHNIIQLAYKNDPKNEPYKTDSGVIVIETNSVYETLKEIEQSIEKLKTEQNSLQEQSKELYLKFLFPGDDSISSFISNEKIRHDILEEIIENKDMVIAEEFFLADVFKKLWKQTEPNGAFEAYADILDVFIDIFKSFDLKSFPPSIYIFFISNFEKLAPSINNTYTGDSAEAYRHWRDNKDLIKDSNKEELKSVSKWNWNIKLLLRRFNFSSG